MDDFSGLEYDQESVTDEDVISKTNNLLSQFNLPTKVINVRDVTASLFVVLYESLFSDRLPDIVRHPVTREDEIHNCQTVIDVLSSDVIKDNLSHIRGVDIVDGKIQSINNLLDIFTFLYEYVLQQIESDIPTDGEDEGKSIDLQELVGESSKNPMNLNDHVNLSSGDQIRKRSNEHSAEHELSLEQDQLKKHIKDSSKNARTKADKDRLENIPSPIQPDASNSLLGCGTLDSHADLILNEGSSYARQTNKPSRSDAYTGEKEKSGQFDFIGVRPGINQTSARVTVGSSPRAAVTSASSRLTSSDAYEGRVPISGTVISSSMESMYRPRYETEHLSADSNHHNLSATDPLPLRHSYPHSSKDKHGYTVSSIQDHNRVTAEKPYQYSDHISGLSTSYENLHNMVQQTAAMTRNVLEQSPFREHQDKSHNKSPVLASAASSFARMARAIGIGKSDQGSQSIGDVGENLKTDTSTKDESVIPPNTDYTGPESVPSSRRNRQKRDHLAKPKGALRRYGRSSDKMSSAERATSGQTTPSASEGEAAARRRKTSYKDQLSQKLDQMGKTEFASARQVLASEEKMFNDKQNYLKKLYQEEFGDVVDEVKNLVGKDKRLMKDMEQEYRKLLTMATGKPAKSKLVEPQWTKGYMTPVLKASRTSSKSKELSRSNSDNPATSQSGPIQLAENEDLMPVLLEEFPNLHISDHTWHELWRQGISQIENLTRAYEENKRRKCKAQIQLEEAARKHEILATIVKKQMDHNQRMNDIKEQKRQQTIANNKLREKRSQAARSKRYFKDYQVQSRSKLLKRRSREETIFKKLFKDGLKIQKDRIQEVRRYAKEQREIQASKRQDEIDSLENYYRDQFEMLVGNMVKDREDMLDREKAHEKLLQQMKRDLRRKMEKEIEEIQSAMTRDDDDTYFRQLEADRLRQELYLAKFQTRL